MDIPIIILLIIAVLLIWIGIELFRINKKLQKQNELARSGNIKLDSHTKALTLSTKALGSIFRAIKSQK